MSRGSVRPRLLDLFCGAGGAAVGYHRAGFDVVGVDHKPQPRYPFEFVQKDALRFMERLLDGLDPVFGWALHDLDAVHASPPCQAYSWLTRNLHKANEYPNLVGRTRELLQTTGLPYVIENVGGSPLRNPVTVCGSSVGLDVRRHRLFETNWPLLTAPCAHGWQAPRFRSLDKRQKSLATIVGVHGHHNYGGEREVRERAMGIAWMKPRELVEAIPPAYTELIGHQLLQYINHHRPHAVQPEEDPCEAQP